MSSEVASLFVRIDADVKEALKNLDQFSDKLEKTGKGVSDIGKGMTTWVTGPMVAAGAGLAMLANNTADYADRISDLTAITGMSSNAIQEWQFVAQVAGVETETVTGAVEGLIKRMPQLQAEGGRATEGLQKLGLSFSDLEQMAPDDMIDTLIESLSSMDDPLERNAIGSSLFGNEWKNIAPILSMGGAAIDEARTKANELGAVMSGDSMASADEYRVGMVELQTQLAAVGRELAESLMPILVDEVIPFIQDSVIPAIQGFADGVSGLFNWFNSLDPAMKGVVIGIVGLVAIIGPVLMGVGQFLIMISALTKISWVVTAAQWLWNAAVSAFPVVAIVLGIAAAVAAIVWMWQNWDSVVTFLKGVWAWMANAFTNMISGIVIKLQEFGSFLGNIFKKAFDGIIYAITHFNIFSLINDYIIKPIFKIDLFAAGKQLIDGLINGAGSMLKNLGKFFLDLVPGWIKGPFKLALGIKSPSKVFAGYGEYIAEGLADGIQNGESIVKNASSTMSDATISGFTMPQNDAVINIEQQNQTIKNEVLVQFGKNVYRDIAAGINEESRYDGRSLIEVI